MSTDQQTLQDDQFIKQVVDDVFRLTSPKVDVARREQILQFITTTINGDAPKVHLAINANLRDNKQGAIVYILTNIRLIKIDIDGKEILSSSFPLDTITNIERKLVEGGRAEVGVIFQNDSFGLKYSAQNQKITDFFLKVDQFRSQRRS